METLRGCPRARARATRANMLLRAADDIVAGEQRDGETSARVCVEVAASGEHPPEHLQARVHAPARQLRIVARPLVAHEGVLRIDLVPGEAQLRLVEGLADERAALRGH